MCAECCGNLVYAKLLSCVPYFAQAQRIPRAVHAWHTIPRYRRLLNNLFASWVAECDLGTFYHIDCNEIRNLQSKRLTPDPQLHAIMPHASLSKAHDTLARNLAHPPDEHASAASVRLRAAFNTPEDWLTDGLFLKAADDLDTLLFGGLLKGRLAISWVRRLRAQGVELAGLCIGATHGGKIRIMLNCTCWFESSAETLWGTLVHEMLHAYFSFMVDWQGCVDLETHGERFVKAAERPAERLDFPGVDAAVIVGGALDGQGEAMSQTLLEGMPEHGALGRIQQHMASRSLRR